MSKDKGKISLNLIIFNSQLFLLPSSHLWLSPPQIHLLSVLALPLNDWYVHFKLLYASVQNGVCFIKLMQRVDDVINVKYLEQWKELNKLVVTLLLVNEVIRIAPL